MTFVGSDSPGDSMAKTTMGRGLAVLADGLQAAFAAGAVAALARGGRRWSRGLGAGLGAQVALLALLGESEEAVRRWRRQGEFGCPLLRSAVAAAGEHLGEAGGVVLLPDAWRLGGWLDARALAEHLAPEAADPGGRLARAGATLGVAVTDLVAGTGGWVELHGASAEEAAVQLAAAARFPGGWEPLAFGSAREHRVLWGGVGAVPADPLPDASEWDVVCGFLLPGTRRLGPGLAIWETVQRRDEMRVGALVASWQAAGARIVAPTEAALRAASGRPDAELEVEYPLPWERNGELCSLLVAMGEVAVGE